MSTPTPPQFPEPAVARQELHFRRLDLRGFARADGLYEIEGWLVDRKPHDFSPASGGRFVPANAPIHDMGVRLVFDDTMLVREVQVASAGYPYPHCPEGGAILQRMVGVRLTGGWAKEVRTRLPHADSCSHLREMLIPMASAAFQALTMLRLSQPPRRDTTGRPIKIDSCYAYGRQRALVRDRYPEYYEPPATGQESVPPQPPRGTTAQDLS